MDTHICMTESLHCSPETITLLLIGYTQIQNIFGVKIKIIFFFKKESPCSLPDAVLSHPTYYLSLSGPRRPWPALRKGIHHPELKPIVYTCPENISFLEIHFGKMLSACLERSQQGWPLRSPPEFTFFFVNSISLFDIPFLVSHQCFISEMVLFLT